MKIPSTSLRTPLARVRGLGAAKDGTHHWWLERLTSLALIPLTVWFIYELMTHLLGASREQVQAWLAEPFTALLMGALIITVFWHSKLGVQVIVEDYVHNEGRKLALLLFSGTAHLLLGALGLMALAKLHFIGI